MVLPAKHLAKCHQSRFNLLL